MKICIVCGCDVDPEVVRDEFEDLFYQANALGMESLTENQQVVVDGKVCSFDCYLDMD